MTQGLLHASRLTRRQRHVRTGRQAWDPAIAVAATRPMTANLKFFILFPCNNPAQWAV